MLSIPILIALFFLFDFAILIFIFWKKQKRKLSPRAAEEIKMRWQKIATLNDDKMKILEADKLLDYTLASCGYAQNSLGEKLKIAGPRFSDLNGVWSAHKLRNRLAHEMDFHLNANETRRALESFKKAIGDLGVE
jgi:hypothetical protein